ncbi:MAG: UDP-N-acetylmuramate dehydrogenase [Lachnospiraceae bacterium]|nr:UDP-N-acetylmuramate dehydrogenase [Lachnospiraceae bacterium]MBR6664338.1 UDP-N-acetylmuramate dehydrogenase [Lachnospiraceae bacterium]
MISSTVVKALEEWIPTENIFREEPMNRHTTFRIGGNADCLLQIENAEQLSKVKKYLKTLEIPYFVIGNGSNLLVSDEGYRGIILVVSEQMSDVKVEGNRIIAQAGALMSKIARVALEHGLTGFEFASGIPGTIGGGVVMNAGAYDGELKQVVSLVKVIGEDGECLELDNETMEFGYRTSAIKNTGFTAVEVQLDLQPGDKDTIKARMDELTAKRREKQPLEYPSAGSTFKRPQGHFAGALIMNAGLRGYQVGDAQVSEKHCGFVINKGKATAADVLNLMTHVQKEVKEQFDVELEPEVIVLR